MYWYITMDRASDIMILHNWPEITFDHTIIQGGHIIKSNFVNKSFFICSESKQNKMLLERTLGRRGVIRMGGFFVSGTCDCRNVVIC